MHHLKKTCLVGILLALLALLGGRPAGARAPRAMSCGGWTIVPSPNPSNSFDTLYRVAALSSADVWAVGVGFVNNKPGYAIIDHWDGVSWQVVPNPSPPGSDLAGLAALSSTNIWAVGSTNSYTLIEHWDGTSWQVVPSPNVGNYTNELVSISAVSPSDIWTVGVYAPHSGSTAQTLIEYYC